MAKPRIRSTDKWQAIKAYVTIRYGGRKRYKRKGKVRYRKVPPTHSQKLEVARYYALLYGSPGESGLLSSSRKLVRVRGAKRKEIANAYAQIPAGYPKLKGVLLPVANEGDAAPRLSFDGDELTVTEDHVRRTFYHFEDYETDTVTVIDDAGAVAGRIVRRKKKRRRWKLACGKHQSRASFDDSRIVAETQRYYDTYKDVDEWCNGLIAYEYTSKKSWEEYQELAVEGRKKAAKRIKSSKRTIKKARRGKKK